ncbi:MAG: 4Fe-4S dicluster domain-containing protein [Bacteroidota bacterium]
MTRINPEFSEKLSQYGGFDLNACYNCGNCTAVCSLSDEDNSFPRNMVRDSVLGLESDIQSSLHPWLCYYCGECSTTCPRQAFPGELMMSLRRWLTAKYDWTGLSGLLYRSLPLTIVLFLAVAAGVIGFGAAVDFEAETLIHTGHLFEMIAIGSVFAIVLLPNIIRMWMMTVKNAGYDVKPKTYVDKFKELIIHMFTQKRTLGCDDSYTRWLQHLILVIGYLTLLFTTVFLNWFGTESLFVIILGYTVSAAIFSMTFLFMRGRVSKKEESSRHSHPTDWMFVVWLFLMGLSAFTVRLAIDIGILENNIWLYLFHMIILVQWALLIVPFGKWTHFLYRSFAMYFDSLRNA